MTVRAKMRKKLESELAAKGKNWKVGDKQKALDERWGQFCETQRSVEELKANERSR